MLIISSLGSVYRSIFYYFKQIKQIALRSNNQTCTLFPHQHSPKRHSMSMGFVTQNPSTRLPSAPVPERTTSPSETLEMLFLIIPLWLSEATIHVQRLFLEDSSGWQQDFSIQILGFCLICWTLIKTLLCACYISHSITLRLLEKEFPTAKHLHLSGLLSVVVVRSKPENVGLCHGVSWHLKWAQPAQGAMLIWQSTANRSLHKFCHTLSP